MEPSFLFRATRKSIRLLGLRRFVIKLAMVSPSLAITRFLLPIADIPLDMSIPERLQTIQRIMSEAGLLSRPVRVLEIGTWCAEGSTKLFAEILPHNSTLVYMDTWRPWASAEDLAKSENRFFYQSFDDLATIAFRIANQNIRKYERSSRCKFVGIVGSSENVVSILALGPFDAIYIDGSHYYHPVTEDIRLAKRAVAPGGLLIGDDFALNFPLRPDLLTLARENVAHDAVLHPDVPSGLFHPGVALALHENFESLTQENGLWHSRNTE